MRRMPASASWLCSVASVEEMRFRQPARLNARSSEIRLSEAIRPGRSQVLKADQVTHRAFRIGPRPRKLQAGQQH
jgi:hypothetical protein